MEDPTKKLTDILEALQKQGALNELILIGSWCLPIYEALYNTRLSTLRTSDMDWLVHNPKHCAEANVDKALTDLGYHSMHDFSTGLVKYMQEDFTVEFLTPITKRPPEDTSRVMKVPRLHINAQILRFMDIPARNHISTKYKGFQIKVPKVTAYILHKAIVAPLRTKETKRLKDEQAVLDLAPIIANDPELLQECSTILNDMPIKWKRQVNSSLKKIAPAFLELLLR